MSNFFLVKTEPSTYSISDLERDKITLWDGVHNFQAINVIKEWQIGDILFIYHSGDEKKIVGFAKVVSDPKENLADIRTSWVAEIEFLAKFVPDQEITLKEIKQTGLFENFLLVRHPRLSVMPCPTDFVEWMQKRTKLSFDIE